MRPTISESWRRSRRRKIVDNDMLALIMQEDGDQFGRVEVWSIDFEDEEVRRLTHRRGFVAKDDGLQFSGICLMVNNEASKLRGYATDGGRVFDICFAAKPVPEQMSECEKVIIKVHTVLESLNIPMSWYEIELDD